MTTTLPTRRFDYAIVKISDTVHAIQWLDRLGRPDGQMIKLRDKTEAQADKEAQSTLTENGLWGKRRDIHNQMFINRAEFLEYLAKQYQRMIGGALSEFKFGMELKRARLTAEELNQISRMAARNTV